MNSDGKQRPARTNGIERRQRLILQADNLTPSIFQKLRKTVTMGCHDLRLVEGAFNEEEGTEGCFRAGRLTAVSPEGQFVGIL